jgi:hypothetical protein
VAWRLKQHGVTPQPSMWRVATLRQSISAMLIRAGERLANVRRSGVSVDMAAAADTLTTAG